MKAKRLSKTELREHGVVDLVSRVQRMVEEFGDPTGFDANAWTMRWLREPNAALGGRAPLELMDTLEGQAQVFAVLISTQNGTCA